MKFILIGNPIAKKRHYGCGKKAFDPQKKEKEAVKAELIHQVTESTQSTNYAILSEIKAIGDASNFRVSFEFHEEPNKSDLWGLNLSNSKCDIDNYIKFILDVCNGILFSDDHKVVEIHAVKCYNPFVKTIINIEPMTSQIDLTEESKLVLKAFTPADMREFLDDIWGFTFFHSADFEVMPQSEWESWMTNVSSLQANFAKKWGEKLHKLSKKIEKSNV